MKPHQCFAFAVFSIVSIGILGCSTGSSRKFTVEPAPVGVATSIDVTGSAPRDVAPVGIAPTAASSPKTIKLELDALFSPSSSTLDTINKIRLKDFLGNLRDYKPESIYVAGHADPSERQNDLAAFTLSKARADEVSNFLVAQGIGRNLVSTSAKGTLEPAVRLNGPANKAFNRRVEVEIVATRFGEPSAVAATRRKEEVPVLFGTNRRKSGKSEPALYFGSEPASGPVSERLTMGRVIVRVPPHRHRGEIKEPGFLHVIVESATSSSAANFLGVTPISAVNQDTDFSFSGPLEEFTDFEFSQQLRSSLKQSKSKAALVYVHGFANSFKDASFRAAQFAYDLADEKYDVVPVLFSWPSDALKVNYTATQDRDWAAGKQLALFLDKITTTTGAGVVHIVAHSKGAKVLGIALDTIRTENLLTKGKDGKLSVPRFNQIIFASPDILAEDFEQIVLPAVTSHHYVTNYVSSNDAALQLSKKINQGARAGDSGNSSVVVAGVETIDVTSVNYRAGGHSSFADSPRVIADIREQLQGSSPDQRKLQMVPRKKLRYWLLKE